MIWASNGKPRSGSTGALRRTLGGTGDGAPQCCHLHTDTQLRPAAAPDPIPRSAVHARGVDRPRRSSSQQAGEADCFPPETAYDLGYCPAAARVLGMSRLPSYPFAERWELTDVLHGQTVADPYRWLEQTDLAATKEWSQSQDALFTSATAMWSATDWFRT